MNPKVKQDKPIIPFVHIKPDRDGIHVEWGATTFIVEEGDDLFSCHIPALDIYFMCKGRNNVSHKSDIITKLFFDHFFVHNEKNALKKLGIELHKLGFKTNNDAYVISQMAHKNAINAKFKNSQLDIPKDFANAERISRESGMAVSI